jgi:hypothetical protein
MKSAIVAVLAVLTLAVAGCSSAGSGAEDVSATPSSPSAATADAETADAATVVDAAGGPMCDVLTALYQDITTLPARVESEGVSSDDVDVIMSPAQAMKDDLPGLVGTVLPILNNDVRAASVFDTAAEVEKYFARGTHDTALEELVKGTRTACDLPASWPEEG